MGETRAMTMLAAVRSVLGKYADFNGRARRSEYWNWVLALLLTYAAILLAFRVLIALTGADGLAVVAAVLLVGLSIGTFLPSFAVGARRLHDSDKPGWLVLLTIVPLGGIALIVLFCLDSSGDNQYGRSPKNHSAGHGYSG